MKGIYKGPQHYWHEYSLVPREKYYYGYYGMYGPYTDLSMYEPVEELSNIKSENTTKNQDCGCSEAPTLLSSIIYFAIAWCLLRLIGVL